MTWCKRRKFYNRSTMSAHHNLSNATASVASCCVILTTILCCQLRGVSAILANPGAAPQLISSASSLPPAPPEGRLAALRRYQATGLLPASSSDVASRDYLAETIDKINRNNNATNKRSASLVSLQDTIVPYSLGTATPVTSYNSAPFGGGGGLITGVGTATPVNSLTVKSSVSVQRTKKDNHDLDNTDPDISATGVGIYGGGPIAGGVYGGGGFGGPGIGYGGYGGGYGGYDGGYGGNKGYYAQGYDGGGYGGGKYGGGGFTGGGLAAGGGAHKSGHFTGEGVKGVTGHNTQQAYNKLDHGKIAKVGSQGSFGNQGALKKGHHSAGAFNGNTAYGKKGHQGHNVGHKGYKKKGHKTKGFHNVYSLNEYSKNNEFYDENHDGAHNDKYSGHREHYGDHGAKQQKGGHLNSAFQGNNYGQKGFHNKGNHHTDLKGNVGDYGHKAHYGHGENFANKAGHDHYQKKGVDEQYKYGGHKGAGGYHGGGVGQGGYGGGQTVGHVGGHGGQGYVGGDPYYYY